MNENILKCKNCNSTEVLQYSKGYMCRNCGISWKVEMESNKLAKPKEFKVNDYLSLKLEDNITNIYIKGRLFQQCKYLLLNIHIDEITSLDNIQSIDEAAEMLDRSLEGAPSNLGIPPETEFWGHCSNLQVWYENNYDTRLIHSNLAFPLLKRLEEAGDMNAQRIFKEEIVKRYTEGNKAVQMYFMEQNYLDDLNDEEFNILVLELFEKENLPSSEYIFFQELQSLIDEKIQIYKDPTYFSFPSIVIENNRISQLRMEDQNINELPKSIRNLKSLKHINLNHNQLRSLPKEICELISLEEVFLLDNSITELPKSIGKLTYLRHLDLTRNELDSLPLSMAKLKELEYLNLNFNNFQEIPKIIGNIESLKCLFIDYNQ